MGGWWWGLRAMCGIDKHTVMRAQKMWDFVLGEDEIRMQPLLSCGLHAALAPVTEQQTAGGGSAAGEPPAEASCQIMDAIKC